MSIETCFEIYASENKINLAHARNVLEKDIYFQFSHGYNGLLHLKILLRNII
jgi:hypothetical protein